VIEKSLSVGLGGVLATDVQMALSGLPPRIYPVIAGLGGRAITKASLEKLFRDAIEQRLEPVTFLDLNTGVIIRHLERESRQRLSGPVAENILRDIGIVDARIG
jgi:pyruvate ferredoxin oxidoreductase alpha subunit